MAKFPTLCELCDEVNLVVSISTELGQGDGKGSRDGDEGK